MYKGGYYMTEKEYLEFKNHLEMNDELNFYYKGE